jgi:hypothetical protein
MQETIEFRIPERNAVKHLPDEVGERLSDTIRKVVVSTDDPLFDEIGRLQREFREKGDFFFLGREYRRRYSRQEIERAELFYVWPKRVFEPAGEECGTQYDASAACPECGAGGTQTSDLRLDLRKVPRSADFAETIAGEQIVSQRCAECLHDAGLRGFVLSRVRHKARYEDDPIDFREVPTGREILRQAEAAGVPHHTWSFMVWLNREENRALCDKAVQEYAEMRRQQSRRRGTSLPVWYQLTVTSPPIEICPPTRAGDDPFDEDSYGRCAHGHVIGLRLLSEVTVSRGSLPDADVMTTKQMVGVRRGLLRPRPLLLLSPKAWRAIEEAQLKGIAFEVAYVS